jgi:RTX calcium-binding nonapeptide repeat (4 copies)
VSIDGVANDGKPPTQHYTGEHDNVETDVENVTGGDGSDTIVGSDPHRAGRTPAVGGQNVLTGGPGNDVIDGGGGSVTLVGGTGDDQLRSRDGAADVDICGAGSDTANADTQGTFVGCELVSHSAAVAFGGRSGFDRRFLLPAALVLVARIAASRLSAWLRRSRKQVCVSPS